LKRLGFYRGNRELNGTPQEQKGRKLQNFEAPFNVLIAENAGDHRSYLFTSLTDL